MKRNYHLLRCKACISLNFIVLTPLPSLSCSRQAGQRLLDAIVPLIMHLVKQKKDDEQDLEIKTQAFRAEASSIVIIRNFPPRIHL